MAKAVERRLRAHGDQPLAGSIDGDVYPRHRAAENPRRRKPAPLCSRVASCVDAAIAANAVMGVVAPDDERRLGDLFAIVHYVSAGAVHGLNASGGHPRVRRSSF